MTPRVKRSTLHRSGVCREPHPGWGLRLSRPLLRPPTSGVSGDQAHLIGYPCYPQMLMYMFYVLPFYGLATYALTFPGCSWLPDWALVFAGAIGQVRGGG